MHDFISGSKPNDAFAHMFLKDELGKLQIDVFAPDLSGVESISEGVEVLAKAIEERQTERNEREGEEAAEIDRDECRSFVLRSVRFKVR